MQPKVKFLTVVWGESYIERFCSLSLPSFLAPGNLPALAKSTQLEVVIMTRRNDFEYFECHLGFIALSKICQVRFVEIDDLISSAVYGVTLTLAYARPIIAEGQDMLNTHFVFMNADFVLANGSLAALCTHILDGRSIVLGPSFRATAEEVEPILEAAVDKTGCLLDMEPRRMVELALKNLHPTTFAKNVNQKMLCSTHPNQFYWSVDEHTMIGRCYLIFMLCLKPERIIESINCYCDYSFIPELCPSGDEVILNDSDDFFMLETQARHQEKHMLRAGKGSKKEIALSLQEWTTFEHRRAASYDIVFHSKDVPPQIEVVKAEAKLFIDSLSRYLGSPVSHINHRYWVSGVEAWRSLRSKSGLSVTVPELAPYSIGLNDRLRIWRAGGAQLIKSFIGAILSDKFSDVNWWSPINLSWHDYRLFQNICNDIVDSGNSGDLLIVRDSDDAIEKLIGSKADVQYIETKKSAAKHRLVRNLKSTLDRSKIISCTDQSNIVLYINDYNKKIAQQLIEESFNALSSNGTLYVYINFKSQNSLYDGYLSDLLFNLGGFFSNSVQSCTIRSFGGPLIKINRLFVISIMRMASIQYRLFRYLSLIWMAPVIALAAIVTSVCNLYLSLFYPKSKIAKYCSSILVKVTRC